MIFVSDSIVDLNLFRRGGEVVFPLYIYIKSDSKKKAKFNQLLMFEPEEEYQAIVPNIPKDLIVSLVRAFKKSFLNPLEALEAEKKEEGFGSKNIFYYIYAILYSNTYRTKYAEFLKIDFPRVPFTKNYKLFIQLGNLGKRIADLHLLKSKELEKIISKFPIPGNYKVDKLKYENEKVWINKDQYFENVKDEVWQYQIGGYQVCEKWLKDRKGRTLDSEEVQTYCKILTALSKTIVLQNEIDKLYESVEENLI